MSRFATVILSLVSVSIMLSPLASPGIVSAAPVEATFFPNSAQVTEVSRVKIQAEGGSLKKAVFNLPGQADPDTLITRITGNSKAIIEDQTWRQVSSQDEAAVRGLKKKIDLLKEERI
ncbi:MAG: DUF4140 domain-containing protein, partial [Syntrophales bacterium]|nr:DUF4140 domain-containing protein [Syntrophales bacterium]